jgi:hypothetical protein
MRERARHSRMAAAFADTNLVIEPINLAVPRTNATGPQQFHRLHRALLKKSLLESPHVSRQEFFA